MTTVNALQENERPVRRQVPEHGGKLTDQQQLIVDRFHQQNHAIVGHHHRYTSVSLPSMQEWPEGVTGA